MRWLFAGFCFLLSAELQAEAPDDFAFALTLEPAGPEALLRVDLPPAVFEGVVRPDLGDLRVFNAAGEVVPHAWLPQPKAGSEPLPPVRLPFFPLRGDPTAGVDGVQVRIERVGGRAVVTMKGNEAPVAHATLLGYLIDASGFDHSWRALLFELPPTSDDVVTRIRVEASDDLRQWTTLVSEAPVLRLTTGGQRLELGRVEFPPRRARYWRLTWPNAPALDLAGLASEPGAAVVEAPRQWKRVTGNALPDQPGQYEFDLGGQFPVDRLRLLLPHPNTVASVELLSRARDRDPWLRRSLNVVYRFSGAGQEVVSPDLQIAASSERYWLLRVDRRGGGLGGGAPELEAGWLTQGLVFAARGPAPFQLAYGSRSARPAAYPITTLLPGHHVEGDDRAGLTGPLSIGRASAGTERTLAGARATREAIDWQRWALWASLLAGVALLGGMAWRLSRQLAPPSDGGKGG